MDNYVAYVDESGSKSNANTKPKDSSSIGLAVAIVIRRDSCGSFLDAVKELLPCSLAMDSHITDWDADLQCKAKDAVFSAIKKYHAVILYDAITVEGFHHSRHVILEEMKQKGTVGRRGPVSVSGSHNNPRMHAELLAGVMTKVRGLAADWCGDPTASHIAFRIDQVDSSILKDARALMAEIDSVGDPHSIPVTGFDTEKKAVVEGEISSSVKGLDDLELPRYTVEISPKTNYGIFAADVIANTLFRHFRELIASSGKRVRLNQREAVLGFELQDCIGGLSNNDTSDCLYGFRDIDNLE